jgi:hypothetical protein
MRLSRVCAAPPVSASEQGQGIFLDDLGLDRVEDSPHASHLIRAIRRRVARRAFCSVGAVPVLTVGRRHPAHGGVGWRLSGRALGSARRLSACQQEQKLKC